MKLDRDKVRHSADYTKCLCSFGQPQRKQVLQNYKIKIELDKKAELETYPPQVSIYVAGAHQTFLNTQLTLEA